MKPFYGKRGSTRVREGSRMHSFFSVDVLKSMGNSDFDLESERVRERSRMQPDYGKRGFELEFTC